MSATATATATAAVTTAVSAAAERHTYWCHECDMSVTLLSPSSSSLICPHCFTDYLEHMDFTNPISGHPPDSDDLPATTSDDNNLLNSPQFLRLFQDLADSPPDSDVAAFTPIKPSVMAIPTIKVSSTMLEQDPVLLCAICKDPFLLEVEAKRLPCSHLYHPDCILPWLSNHDSCPLCRFKLPSDEIYELDQRRGAATTVALMRARDLMHQEDSYGLGTTLRHIARRHNSVFGEGIQVDSENVSSVANGGVIVIVDSSGDENEVVGIDGSVVEDAGSVV